MDILKQLEPTSVFNTFDLLSTGIAIFTVGIIGFIVFLNNRKSVTNQLFFWFSLMTILLSVFNYLSYQSNSREIVIWFLRGAMFFAVWHSFSFFSFCYAYPKEKIKYPVWYNFILAPLVFSVSILTLTTLVFAGIAEFYPTGQISKVINGPAIPLFGTLVAGLIVGGIYLLFKKAHRSERSDRAQLKFILAGVIITFALIIFFNFVLPAIFNISQFVSLLPVFLLPFIVFTFYAIAKHQLFDIKVIGAESLVFVLWIAMIVEFLIESSLKGKITVGIVLALLIVFGILLIRNVRKEVSQREKFELLSKELAMANAKLQELDQMKTDFISIASHQLRTPLTAIKGYSSMILEGTYGDTSLKIKGAVDKIFQSAQRLIYIVNDLLDISRIEQGRFQPVLEEVKIANVLRDVVEELKPNAQKKNLDLSFDVSVDDAEVKIKVDPSKIRQVLTNLVDNAIKYTEQGYVKAEIKKNGGSLLISVADSGAGISLETLSNLFQKFTRAKNVAKLHTDGSGLGLYIAKQIIDAHNGKIWAESAGEGQGSCFCVELPMG